MNFKKGFATITLAGTLMVSNIVPVNVLAAESISINSTENQSLSLLPPLESVIKDDFNRELPTNTFRYRTTVTAPAIDFVPLETEAGFFTLPIIEDIIQAAEENLAGSATTVILGYIDSDNNVYQSEADLRETMDALIPPENITIMINPSSELARGTKVQLESYWERVSNQVYSSSQGEPMNILFDESHGITRTEGYRLAQSVGVSISGEVGGITAELSSEISETFSQSISFSESFSQTNSWNFLEQNTAYTAAVYQLKRKYTIIPGKNLDLSDSPFSLPSSFEYSGNVYRAVVRLDN
ncbi:hypothetical protein [Cytobacillus sp. IB215665]|uniref:hypothetical protein n=1 Tax=Cytobacillus sp. IB215665 TaxID=3097357 RepID=UPI002A14D542|nr:hypothetical protein [Cytobacillus sp. IB215665]MDX8366581.1 hypothetical protein [Cytobacillus sp. IB215665]